MSADPGFMVLLSASMFAGALVSSFAGFAFAPVAAVLLVAALDPRTLIPLLMICSLMVQFAGLIRLRRSIAWGHSDAMLLGGAAGVPLAVMLLPHLDTRLFQVGFGVFLMGYAVAMLTRRVCHRVVPPEPRRELAVGFFGGLIGGLTAMPGAIPVLYCDLCGLSKARQRGLVQPYIMAMQMLALAILGINGEIGTTVLWHVATALPALALGTVVGLALFGRVPDAGFRRMVLVVLLATGLGALGGRETPQISAFWSMLAHDPPVQGLTD